LEVEWQRVQDPSRKLGLSQVSGTIEIAVHFEKCYYVPPIDSITVSTGDLLPRGDGVVEVVITPRCDIAHSDKSSTIQLAECESHTTEWEHLKSESTSPDLENQAPRRTR
jgi:hypothetical protein